MKGRESKGPPSADLLVCFPSRAHLTLMPKPICSPARPSEPSKRHHNHHHNHNHNHNHHHHHHLKKSSTRGGGGQGSSPLLWAKTKPMGYEISEPTSPKVTCAGQIKVRPKASSCKNWQSVMEEIERLHNNRKHKKKRANWVENLGFKKDAMQFLTCLRRIRFDFRCFGSFPTQGLTSEDEEEEEEEEEEEDFQLNHVGKDGNDGSETSRTVFSKWFMVLQEEQNIHNRFTKEESKRKDKSHKEEPIVEACAPPPNALLLMRCRSAPAKTGLEEREHEDDKDDDEEEEEYEAKLCMEEEKRSKSLAAVMRRDTDFYNVSSDIAKETWVNVGGLKDPLSRSRSWKR